MNLFEQSSDKSLFEELMEPLSEYLDSWYEFLSSPALQEYWNAFLHSAYMYGKLAVVLVFVAIVLYLAIALVFGS